VTERKECPACDGEGIVEVSHRAEDGEVESWDEPCLLCDGTGAPRETDQRPTEEPR